MLGRLLCRIGIHDRKQIVAVRGYWMCKRPNCIAAKVE